MAKMKVTAPAVEPAAVEPSMTPEVTSAVVEEAIPAVEVETQPQPAKAVIVPGTVTQLPNGTIRHDL